MSCFGTFIFGHRERRVRCPFGVLLTCIRPCLERSFHDRTKTFSIELRRFRISLVLGFVILNECGDIEH